jgi:hypothetical protein
VRLRYQSPVVRVAHLGECEPSDAADRKRLKEIHKNTACWQHWVLRRDDGTIRTIEMPHDDVLLMVRSWPDGWYETHMSKMVLHPRTRRLVEKLLGGG